MPALYVVTKHEDIDADRLDGTVVVVIDVLFASTTIVHALSEGASAVWPARDRDDALRLAAGRPGCVLAGEHMADAMQGFAPATPLALAAHGLHGRDVVYSTTNGTPALLASAAAAHVYVGCLLNGAALAAHIVHAHPRQPVLLVCAGSVDRFNLEDFEGAGHIANHLLQRSAYDAGDTALAAGLARHGGDPRTALQSSRVGRLMHARGLAHEVAHASACDTLSVVPVLRDGRLLDIDA